MLMVSASKICYFVNLCKKYKSNLPYVRTGPLKRIFGWNGWTAIARMSLSVLILHWCVNMVIAARPVAYNTSFLDVVSIIS